MPIVSVDELRAADISGPIKDRRKSDCRDFEWVYAKAAEMAQTAGQETTARAYRLMAALCSFHFRGVFRLRFIMVGFFHLKYHQN